MLIKPDWDIFRAKFSQNPQDVFEWFCYLLFCREHNLDKGWYGYKNQSGIEKEPLELDDKVIGFQAKFYDTPLSANNSKLLNTLRTVDKDYPRLTHLVIYTNKAWGQGKNNRKSQALQAIENLASSLNIEIIWRDSSYFESEFVCIQNNDLARYFFTNEDYKGWHRFKDWSSTPTNMNSEYLVDENIKIVLPDQNVNDAINVVEGINVIREKLNTPQTSVRLVGLSGVGKTRLAQALFDERIGKKPLDIRQVWYCDAGQLPEPNPIHFISILKDQNTKFVVIVDNCGKEEHSNLAKSICEDGTLISLLTIEYDISDDLPEKTQVFKLEPNSPAIVEKVIERCYPNIQSPIPKTIAQHTGGNYRLALAISSTIENVNNISVLKDHQLFNRLFYQNGQINEEHYKIAQIFSLVYSFNINDLNEPHSELQFLSNIADIKPRVAKRAIEQLKAKDIVQARGDFRAILPHVLANHLSKQALLWLNADELVDLFIQMPVRLQRSIIKRISYLHDNKKIICFVRKILHKEGYIGKRLLEDSITDEEFNYLRLLVHIEPNAILDLIHERYIYDNNYLTQQNARILTIKNLLKHLAYQSNNFEKSFNLLLIIAKHSNKDQQNLKILASMFRFYASESLADLSIKKNLLQKLFDDEEYEILLAILETAINFRYEGILYLNRDIGSKEIEYGYQAKTYGEIWDWVGFLLDLLYELEQLGYDVRNLLAQNLSGLIRECVNIDILRKYLLKLNHKKPFHQALNQLNLFITDNQEELQNNCPLLLKDLKALVTELEPSLVDLKKLIQTYILVDDFTLGNYQSNYGYLGYNIFHFESYNHFIEYISDLLLINDNWSTVIPLLLSSNNSNLERIGKKIYTEVKDKDNLIKLISESRVSTNNKRPFFLLGLLRQMKVSLFEDYKSVILSLLKIDCYKNIVPWLTVELSQTDKDFEFISELLDSNLMNDVSDFALISLKKKDNEISIKQFESVFDLLIKHGHEKAVQNVFRLESIYSGKLADKYVDPLMARIEPIYNSFAVCELEKLLELLLSKSEVSAKIFDIFKSVLESKDYLSLAFENKDSVILKMLIKHDTQQFLEKFIETSFLQNKIIFIGDLNKVLCHAETEKVLAWIGNNQERITYWAKNSYFLEVTTDLDRTNEVSWNSMVLELINRSNNPQETIDDILEMNIFDISGVYSESRSNRMRSRLGALQSFKEYLTDNNFEEYISYVEIKQKDWLEAIRLEELREADEKKQQGFDY